MFRDQRHQSASAEGFGTDAEDRGRLEAFEFGIGQHVINFFNKGFLKSQFDDLLLGSFHFDELEKHGI